MFNILQSDIQFSSVQLLSHVRLFATPWIAARQAFLSITNSRSLLKPMSILGEYKQQSPQLALVVKNLPTNAGDIKDRSLIPGLGRSPGGGHGNQFQYFCLENPHGQRSLEGFSPWGHKQLNTNEWLCVDALMIFIADSLNKQYV